MSNKKFNKICSVCGEKAFGFNFCAISCESCKAFFRRNASKLDEYKCRFENKCEIDQVTRKCCRKCRLRKCFAVGMKEEWILSDEQKKKRKNKIQENKKYRKNTILNTDKCLSVMSSQNESFGSDFYDSQVFKEITTNLTELQNYSSIEEKIVNKNNNNNNNEISEYTYKKAVELELAVLPIARPINNYLNLNEVECNRLIELLNATLILKTSYPTNPLVTGSFEDLVRFFLNKFELFTEKFVKVVKNLNSFTNICENDQIALVKYSTLEVLLMRTALFFNYEKEHWVFIMDNKTSIIFKLEVLRNNKRNTYSIFKNYFNKIGKEWDNDSFIMDLLMTILLFDPDRPNIIHREPIKLQQQLYMHLLQRYLQLKYVSECESKVKFLRILNVIKDLQQLHEIHRLNYREVNPQYFGPLLKEILDITSENRIPVL